MPKVAALLAALLLAACATRTPAPECRGDVFPINAAEAPR